MTIKTAPRFMAAGITILVLFVLFSWFFRYQITSANNVVYKYDRWTGVMYVCYRDGCLPVEGH